MGMTRSQQKMNTIYVLPSAAEGDSESVFFTPDGVGRLYYDTVNECKEDTGIERVIYLLEDPDEF